MNDTTFQGDGKVAYVPVVVNTNLTKPSNADRIRAMDDEELAKHICCPHDQCIDLDRPCDECVLDWLKSPVEVDE